MAKHVNKVLVAKQVGTLTSLVAGDLLFFSENNVAAVSPVATARKAKAGIVNVTDGILVTDATFSDVISRDNIEAITFEDYQAPIASTAVVTFAAPIAGNKYILRVSYNDVTEMPVQFTQSFEVVAATGETAATLADKFRAVISSTSTVAGRNARVTATDDNAGVLTLTAKTITADDKLNTPYEFHMIQIGAVSLMTKDSDGAFVTGATTIVITAADKGCGYWKVVRDEEKKALSYRGSMFPMEYWYENGTMNTEVGASYSKCSILYNNNYRSANNQFIESTPLLLEIYVKGTTFPATQKTSILAWANNDEVIAADDNTSAVL